jgi:integrase
MKPRERPTFHEIRGLGSRLYREQGMSKAAIQALMTHTNERVTEIYLDGGTAALKDDDYLPVAAPMVLGDILKR